METIERKKTFTFLGEKVTVTFPNVGQMIDLESLKQSLTGNKYGAMAASGVRSAFYALDMVDALAFFEVLCPRIRRMMQVKNLAELSPERMKIVVDAYKEHVQPWYNSLLENLYTVGESHGNDQKSDTVDGED